MEAWELRETARNLFETGNVEFLWSFLEYPHEVHAFSINGFTIASYLNVDAQDNNLILAILSKKTYERRHGTTTVETSVN